MNRAIQSIRLKAYAKINLGLFVLGRREDGFHELRTIYQSISLADELEIGLSGSSGPVRIECSGWNIPVGAENLAVRAAEVIRKELRLRRGIWIRLRKRIPPASGLGGASSDAATVLRGVLALSGKTLPSEALLHLAGEMGSDVPFFLIGGRAVGLGRGDEVYPLPEGPRRPVVILFSGDGMKTAEAYRLLQRPQLTGAVARPTIELFCGRIPKSGDSGALRLYNDFEPLLFQRLPQLARAKKELMRCGAEVASLSGSGTAVFGMFLDAVTAKRAAQALRRSGAQTWVVHTVSRREFSMPISPARGG